VERAIHRPPGFTGLQEVVFMADQQCPNCGRDLPPELGQHSLAPMTGLVMCPHCGAEVRLAKESATSGGASEGDPGRGEPNSVDFEVPGAEGREPAESHGTESFSGHETVSGVMKEIEEKDPERGTDRS
jgi:ribosomal protein S27AE